MTIFLARLHSSVASGLMVSAVIAALVVTVAMPRAAQASEHRIIVGLATTSAYVTTWWHGPGTALDLDFPSGGSGGANVYWQSHDTVGQQGRGMYLAIGYYPGTCTGVQVDAYDWSTYAYLGPVWYTHISSSLSTGYYWFAYNTNSWTIQHLGSVLWRESAACINAGLWSAPHLHQGADNGYPSIYTNWGLSSYGNPINPTGDYWNRWMHRIVW